MSEIPNIIMAGATFVGAIAGLAVAVSKCSDFVLAINKMLADQHKRAKELKKQASENKPIATSSSKLTDKKDAELPSPGLKVLSWPSFLTWLLIAGAALSLVSLFLSLTRDSPATTASVAVCVLNALVLIIISVYAGFFLIIRVLFQMYGGILNNQTDLLQMQLDTAQHMAKVLIETNGSGVKTIIETIGAVAMAGKPPSTQS